MNTQISDLFQLIYLQTHHSQTNTTMTKYSYIPPEYKTNNHAMSTSTYNTHQTYNVHATKPYTGKSAFQPFGGRDHYSSPSPWEYEVAMQVSEQRKPKRKPAPLTLHSSPSPWEYQVAMGMSASPKRTRTPKYMPTPKSSYTPKSSAMPLPMHKKPYTSKFREHGVSDYAEPYKADYRAKIQPDFRFEGEEMRGEKKGGKMAKVVKDVLRGMGKK